MQPDPIRFYLRFPDAASALAAAQAMTWIGEDATDLPKDGWWHDDAGSPIAYYVIDVLFGTGEIWRPTGEIDADGAPIMAQVPGFHVNGLWFGRPEDVPDFGEAVVVPDAPVCVFG